MRKEPALSFLLLAITICSPVFSVQSAYADTYGLPPFMTFEKEWRFEKTGLKNHKIFVIRAPDDWRKFWKMHDLEATTVPDVDFDRLMIVGIRTTGKWGRAIYRTQLVTAKKNTSLMIRVARDSAICQRPREMRVKGTKVHIIAIGKCALPVRFVLDDAVDGMAWLMEGQGVSVTPLGTVVGLKKKPRTELKADYREDAEKLAMSALSQREIAESRKKIWPKASGKSYPDLWSIIEVRRLKNHWRIRYDHYTMKVDVSSGKVARVLKKPKDKTRQRQKLDSKL